MLCRIVLLDFIYLLSYKIIKLQHFKTLILLSSLGKQGGREQKAYLLGPQVEPASDPVKS